MSATVPLTVAVVRLRFPGAAASPTIVGQHPLPGRANYVLGNDPAHWLTGVPTYGAVAYQGVYPGIDLVYTGTQHQLEYDWQVAPGADPGAIQMALSGTAALSLDGQGNLLVPTAFGLLEQRAPAAYQVIDGQPQSVSVSYVLDAAGGTVHLSVGSYDHTQPLTIDPVLSYASYLGGGGADAGDGVAVDAAGAAYQTGDTSSTDFPVTNSVQGTYGQGQEDAFVAKLNASGTALLYSTYLGGSSDDHGEGIAVDGSGDAFVTGQTSSGDFPTVNPLQTSNKGGSDAFVAELSPSGSSLLYSTYLGGSADDYGYAIAVDPAGEALVAGRTSSGDFPTANPLQPSYGGDPSDAFVAKLASGGGSLVYSTYLGGAADDEAYGLATDASGDAYVTGRTASPQSSFPLAHALYGTYNGNYDAFVAELTPSGSSLVYSTYLGGTQHDEGNAIAVDAGGAAYVTGYTNSGDFPTAQPLQGSDKGGDDAFVAKLSPGGSSLVYSTYLGGSAEDNGQGLAVDAQGRATVAGYTASSDFPTAEAIQAGYAGGAHDAFVAQLNAAGSALLYSTYLGGSGDDQGNAVALDSAGDAYVNGSTSSTDFPTTPGAYQGSAGGGGDDFVAKIATASSGLVPWHPHRTLALGAGLSLSVDLADGHLDLGAQEMDIAGRGLDLTLDRSWDSTLAQGSLSGPAGQGWQDSLTPSMGGILTGTVDYTDQTGAVWPFVFAGNPSAPGPYTTYDSPPGLPWQLSASTAGYTLTNVLNSDVLAFSASGRSLSTTDSYGNADTLHDLATLPYSETNSSRTLRFSYSGGRLSAVKSPLWWNSGGTQGQEVTYGYNTADQLITRTLGAGSSDAVTSTFGYSGTQLITVTTPAGGAWLVSWDALGRVASVTSPASGTVGQAGYSPAATTQFSYTPGQTQVVAGAGSSAPLTTTYTLDAQGEALSVADGLGDTSRYTYDADHDVLTSQDADHNTTTNYYQYVGPNGSTGLVTETVQPAIQPYSPLNTSLVQPTTTHRYDPSTNDLIETDTPDGGRTLYGYDGHHSVITTTELITGTTQWRGSVNAYDQYGELIAVTDGRGVSVSASGVATLNSQASQYTRHLGYDPQGDQTSASTAPITTTLNGVVQTDEPVTTTYGYDADGDQTSMISANGNTTTYAYDHLGRPISTTLPTVTLYDGTQTRPVQTTTYDALGDVAQTVDGNGDVTSDSYDPQLRLISETNPVSGTTVYTYSATEQTAEQDPVGNVTQYSYDPAGRLTLTTDPVTGTVQQQYDAVGNTTAITTGAPGAPLQVETRQYDALDRVITDTISGPGGPALTTATYYDPDGNAYQTVYPTGHAVINTYDLADELVSTENDPSVETMATHQTQSTFSYDAAGNQTVAIDFGGNSATTTYDPDNRVTQTVIVTSSSTITTTNSYDPDGNTLSSTVQTAMLGFPVQTTVNTATYNAADWTSSTTDNGFTTSYGYDAAGQERTRSTASGTITTMLDAEGRATSIAVTGAGAASYGYNPDDQPVTATLPGGLSAQMGYDPNSDLTSWSYLGPSTGVTTTTVNLGYAYSYDAAQRTSGITLTDNNVVQSEPVTDDAAGRLIGWGGPDGPETWSYDGDGDVISTTGQIAGQLRTTVFTYTPTLPKELVQQHTDGFGVDTYSYDGNGNVTSEVSTDPITSALYVDQHFSYDALERPVTVTNVLHGALVTGTLGYDPAGERITYTAVMSGQVIDAEHYAYNDDGSLAQTTATTATLNPDGSIQSSGAYTDTYAYDPLGQPLFLVRQQNGTTSAYTYLTDGRGDVVGLVDSAGQRVNSSEYDPYGNLVGPLNWQTVDQSFGYKAMQLLNGLGLYTMDGSLYNFGSGTATQADKELGYFNLRALGSNPLDNGLYGGIPGAELACTLENAIGLHLPFCRSLPPISICHTLRECVDVIGEASSIGAMALVFVPGAEPIAGVLGGVALAANAAGTVLDAVDIATNPRHRTAGKVVGFFLDLASLTFSFGGEKLIDYAIVSDKEEAFNAAKARGAPEAVIERFEQETRDAKLLSKKISHALFEPKSMAIDLANQQLGASLENDSAIVTGPDQPTVAMPASPGEGVVSGRLYLYLQLNQ